MSCGICEGTDIACANCYAHSLSGGDMGAIVYPLLHPDNERRLALLEKEIGRLNTIIGTLVAWKEGKAHV